MANRPSFPTTPLRILHVGMELAPWAVAGDVAAVMAGLPAAQHRDGNQVTVVIPDHGCAEWPVGQAQRVQGGRASLQLDHREVTFDLARSRHPSGFEVIVVRSDLYARPGIYEHPDTGVQWPDRLLRASVLCHAALYYALNAGGRWAVIHAHDWHGALTCALLRRRFQPTPLQHTRSVLTIHNPYFAGVESTDLVPIAGLPSHEALPGGPLEADGMFNPLQAGVLFADRIHAVSPRHAMELRARPGADSLSEALRSRADAIGGVLGGIDPTLWNPETDRQLAASFSAEDPTGRTSCQEDLVGLSRLDWEPGSPLIGFVGKLLPEKGLATLVEAIPALVKEGHRFAICGTGVQELQDQFKELSQAHPGAVWLKITNDEGVQRRVLAGLDLFCLPGEFEPSGLDALRAMRYGALPVVRKTGGLLDAVPEEAGFLFDGGTTEDLIVTLQTAAGILADPEKRRARVQAALGVDRTWDDAARELKREMYL